MKDSTCIHTQKTIAMSEPANNRCIELEVVPPRTASPYKNRIIPKLAAKKTPRNAVCENTIHVCRIFCH